MDSALILGNAIASDLSARDEFSTILRHTYPFCGFARCFRTCVVVHVSFRVTHGEQPIEPEFQRHLRFLLRQRSQA
jgi:hypothetical protein